MSFYLTLSSDTSRDTFPNNHGGDFKIQLDHVLDMRSQPWEVALVEMQYTGQAFPNLSTENAQVTLQASGKPEFQNDYIITWDQAHDLTVEVIREKLMQNRPGPAWRYTWIEFPRKHYSWNSFVETFKKLYKEKSNSDELYIKDTSFYFRERNHEDNTRFAIKMSDNFKKLFGIQAKDMRDYIGHDFYNEWVYFDIPIVKPSVIADTSQVIHTPYAKADVFTIEGTGMFYLQFEKDQYWTLNMLAKAFAAITKELKQDYDPKTGPLVDLKSIQLQTDHLQIVTETKHIAPKEKHTQIIFSQSIADVLNLEKTHYDLITGKMAIYPIVPEAPKEKEIKFRTFTASTKLRYDYYPTVKSLVEDLNTVLEGAQADIIKDRKGSSIIHTFFSVGDDNIVKFKGRTGYSVLLDSDVQKMMSLPTTWLSASVNGSLATVLKSYKRGHFYIHCDCMDYHYINNTVSDLLRSIVNSAEVDEKVILSFQDPRYYAVAKRYMSNINMFATDGLFDGILKFNRDVVYTLHFKRSS